MLRVLTERIRYYCHSAYWFWQIAPVSAFTKFFACKGKQECYHGCLSSELHYRVLEERGVTTDVLQLASDDQEGTESLFNPNDDDETMDVVKLKSPSKNLLSGDVQIVFAHPECLLSKKGRELM